MQLSLFDGSKEFKIDKPIRLIELFAGIGSQAKALKNLGVEFEHYRICEFDKYAVASYNAVHGTNFETSDITKITAQDLGIVDTDKYCYIMTYSFPCQDLSNAGLGKGMAKGSGTRSGLLWEVERLLDECSELPNVLLMENVPQVIGQNNIQHFAKWQEKLEKLGYKNKWQVLNAKDYGIPQNRERCFMVSILGDYYYEFSKTIPLKLRLKDMLEKEVDEKYYLSDRAINGMLNSNFNCSTLEARTEKDGVMPTLCARDYEDPKLVIEETSIIQRPHGYNKGREIFGECPCITTSSWQENNFIKEETDKCNCIGTLQGGKWDKMHDIAKRVYSPNGCSTTIHTCGGGNLEPKIAEPLALDEQNKYIRQDGCVGTLTTDGSSPKHNNRVIEPLVWDGYNQQIRVDSSVVGTLTRNCGSDLKRNGQGIIESPYRIRKLTPRECWRLMGFEDKDIDNAIAIGMSNAQLYKQAGNSIVVNVLMAIFSQMI